MVHVSVQVVSSYVTPWLSNTCLISVISFVITLYNNTSVALYHHVSLHSQCTSQNVRSVFVHWTCGHDEESLTLTDATHRTSSLSSSTELADTTKNHWHSLTRLAERPVCVRPLNLRTQWRFAEVADAVKTCCSLSWVMCSVCNHEAEWTPFRTHDFS
jgi:urease accessory protein UreF